MNSINVDIGGTFTDCFVYRENGLLHAKAPTTLYDLSVGFMQALGDAAEQAGIELDELLESVEILRYSTTLAMNRLIERKGPKLGLITTEGFEDITFIGRGGQWAVGVPNREVRCLPNASKPEPIIPRHMVVGVKERVDRVGEVLRPLNEQDLLAKCRYLVDQGVQGFVVCLLYSYLNPSHERLIRDILGREYPDYYLGAVPIVLSSDVMPKIKEYPRAIGTILNAYLHQSMSEELRGMGDELRTMGYKNPIMMVHNSGGMAEVFRTSALSTFNGGPVAGLIGGAYLGSLEGHKNIIVTDMGGTSFDLGLIVEGSTRFYEFRPTIGRWEVDMTSLQSKSIGAGGGSIAWVNKDVGNRLQVGPQSAGSMPGPACYDFGGTEPTVTDADVVLGYINPDNFHGGKIQLVREKAVETIREQIAKPLNIEVEHAALLIKKVVDANMAHTIFTQTVLSGLDPKEFIVYALGGGGPTHCCGYAFQAGPLKVVIPSFASVFCAFGSAGMDIVQFQELSRRITIMTPVTQQYFTGYEQFNSAVDELKRRAIKDLEGQGLASKEVGFSLELDMMYGGSLHMMRVPSPLMHVNNEDDIRSVYEVFEKQYSEIYSPFAVFPQGGVEIQNFVLRAVSAVPKIEIPKYPVKKGSKPRKDSIKGERTVFWDDPNGLTSTATVIYEQSLLEAGNLIAGPAVIESEDTTAVVPPGRRYTVNADLSATIE